jgi:hypothetical protein
MELPKTEIKDSIHKIYNRERSSVVKDFPRLSARITIQRDGEVVSNEADECYDKLRHLAVALGDDKVIAVIDAGHRDLEATMTHVGWTCAFSRVLKLLVQGVPAQVITTLILNAKQYNFSCVAERWLLGVDVKSSGRVEVSHRQASQSALANDPNSATPEKNFIFEWEIRIVLAPNHEKNGDLEIASIDVEMPYDRCEFVDENCNPAWKMRNLIAMLQADCKCD